MENLRRISEEMQSQGYSAAAAEAKACQDIILKAIAKSPLGRNVTIKGGVVMRSITGSIRRATQDIDLDFIHYSLDEQSISGFIKKINCLKEFDISISGRIEELSQQEYQGKRTYITIKDSDGNSISGKIDFGVHTQMDIEQEEHCFDICTNDDAVSLLINSKEQIFTEKLRSLLKLGPFSTRYKDIFDMCYLAEIIDNGKLLKCIQRYIFDASEMRETDINGIISRLEKIFSNRIYKEKIERSAKSNWLGIKCSDAFGRIINRIILLQNEQF